MAADRDPRQFEKDLVELEKLLRELEDGTTTLEESLAKYERGVALVRQCYGQLQSAEQRIRELAGLNDDGSLDLRTFDHTTATDKVNEKAKPARRTLKPDSDTTY